MIKIKDLLEKLKEYHENNYLDIDVLSPYGEIEFNVHYKENSKTPDESFIMDTRKVF